MKTQYVCSILLTATYVVRQYPQGMAVLTWQQWLRERPTMLHSSAVSTFFHSFSFSDQFINPFGLFKTVAVLFNHSFP